MDNDTSKCGDMSALIYHSDLEGLTKSGCWGNWELECFSITTELN